MAEAFEFEHVDVFTTGAIGRPGDRTFFLQARVGRREVSVKCEKQQVAALSDYLRKLLDDLPAPSDRPLPYLLELATPDLASFVVGRMGLAYDEQRDAFVVMMHEVVDESGDGGDVGPDDDEGNDDGSRLQVRLTRGQAAAFVEHADAVVAAGRPACIFCGLPVDPDRHPCPRMN